MAQPGKWKKESNTTTLLGIIARMLTLLLPTILLIGASLRTTGPHQWMLWMATMFQALVCFLSFLSWRSWYTTLGPAVITLYLIALSWIWWGAPASDWYVAVSKAILLIVPLMAFALQTLTDSGAIAIRRARLLADRLARRRDWPNDLASIRELSEVKAFRAALHIDASPALALLNHKRFEVRVAAMAALEFRKEWKGGQVELVLQAAQRAEQPMLRAAAVTALANVDDRQLVERVAAFFHDPAREVRTATVEALLWDTEKRWYWIRYAVRRALADPLFQHDGPLWHDGQFLTREAIDDLTAWTAEKGVLPLRAAITLASHYHRLLSEGPEPSLILDLHEQLLDPTTPSVLRIELAKVLQFHQELDPVELDSLLSAANPTPLRMIVIETILSEHTSGPAYDAAVMALRDLGRLPNREIALSTAILIQKKLGIDLGLGLDKNPPGIHTRQAAEITRRVMLWATEDDIGEDMEEDSGQIITHRV